MPMHLQLARAKSLLERRLFLKALGLGLAAPLALRLSKSATAASPGAAKRLFVMYFPHGIAPEHYNPLMAGDGKDPTQFALDKTNESILGPLEPYKKWVNVYNGFEYPGGYGHARGLRERALRREHRRRDRHARTSIDQAIGKGLGVKPLIWAPARTRRSASTSTARCFGTAPRSTRRRTRPRPPTSCSRTSARGPTVSADEQLRSALVNLTSAEIQDLKKTVAGLTNEKTSSRRTSRPCRRSRTAAAPTVSSCTSMPSLPTVNKVRQESAGLVVQPGGGNDYFYQERNFRTLLKAQLELTAQALICNAAPVIGLMPMYPTAEFDFSFIGGTPGSGGWGHHNGLSHTSPQQAAAAQYNSPVSIDNLKPTSARHSRARSAGSSSSSRRTSSTCSPRRPTPRRATAAWCSTTRSSSCSARSGTGRCTCA